MTIIMNDLQKKTLAVKGMTCASCAARIEKTLAARDGVRRAAVNLAAETLEVEWDAARLSLQDMAGHVAGLGFELVIPAREKVLDLVIKGMTCASCSARIEKVVGGLDGVRSIGVNLAAGTGTAVFDPDAISKRRRPLPVSALKRNPSQGGRKICCNNNSGRPGKNSPE